MNKRVLVAGLYHETNTFVDSSTTLKDFKVARGAELLRCEGDGSPMGGMLETARKLGWTVVPAVDYRATPGGVVDDMAVAAFWRDFLQLAEPAIKSGVDAIYVVFHGAMVSQSTTDVEGEILERIRRLNGAAKLPIFGTISLHANFSKRMAELASVLVATRENPLIDARAVAQTAADALDRCLTSGVIPRTYWTRLPILWPPTGTGTIAEPMRSLVQTARQMEAAGKGILTVNVMPGFAFSDTPDTGLSFSIVTEGDEADAREKLSGLSALAAAAKEEGNVIEPSIELLIPKLSKPEPGLTVIIEPSDNIGAGAPGDGTGVLRALVENNVQNAAVVICDPFCVERLNQMPPGFGATLHIGGRGSKLDKGPLTLEIEVISKGAGRFKLEDHQSPLAAWGGDYFDMGRCAVVLHKGIHILLTSQKTPPFDLGQWRSQGIDPEEFSIIVVKAAVSHRRAYDGIAARSYSVDTPGPCSSNLKALSYKHVVRPAYPLD